MPDAEVEGRSSRSGTAASASGAAILFGALAGAVVVRRAGASVALMMDAVAPGLLLAQGIGRIGNWWNQELYGKPTSLPWGLEIDPAHRPLAVPRPGRRSTRPSSTS